MVLKKEARNVKWRIIKFDVLLFLPGLIFLSACYSGESKETLKASPINASPEKPLVWENVKPAGKTIEQRLPTPPGFNRIKNEPNSIGAYLRNLPVKANGAPVLLFDGSKKPFQDAQIAVIDMEVGSQNLQQCADAVMRLRAEYLFKNHKFKQIHFNFTSGDKADYGQYAQGFRPIINGNSVTWQKKAKPDNSYKTFRQYLNLIFTYAGTASLEKELQPVKSLKEIAPGDVLIQGGHPGHAVMVMDVAVNTVTGKKIFLLAQSYMPAQETHVIKNPNNETLSPWYSTDVNDAIQTPEWSFYPSQLKRFSNW